MIGTRPTELTLTLAPQRRFEAIDVNRRIAKEAGDILRRHRRALYTSFHTTAGYLDQSLSVRLHHRHDLVSQFFRASTNVIAPELIRDLALTVNGPLGLDRAISSAGGVAFAEVDDLSTRLIAKARAASTIVVKSAGGTDVVARFSPKLRWIKTSGIITEEKWGNLPGGEIFTSPATVDGRFVVDGVVGDYLCNKYGDLRKKPLTIEIRDARIVDLQCDDQELVEEFRAYTSTDENSNRVGEFALGTNTAVHDVIGNILQDEKIPGMHMAFGHPYSQHTMADWVSKTHIDCVGRNADVWLDDEQVMAEGRFLI